jgi:hypothetical protein
VISTVYTPTEHTEPTPYIITNNGTVNYFNIFTSVDDTDELAGYTVVSFEDGLPITYKIDVINTENET